MSSKSSQTIILDASALIALLAEEEGKELVTEILPRCIISSVNVAEVAKYLIEKHNLSCEEVTGVIHDLIEQIIPFDEKQAFKSAEICNQTKMLGLSLGDRACLALAMAYKLPVYTADKAWAKLKLDCKIILIR